MIPLPSTHFVCVSRTPVDVNCPAAAKKFPLFRGYSQFMGAAVASGPGFLNDAIVRCSVFRLGR